MDQPAHTDTPDTDRLTSPCLNDLDNFRLRDVIDVADKAAGVLAVAYDVLGVGKRSEDQPGTTGVAVGEIKQRVFRS